MTTLTFGPHRIPISQAFLRTKLTYGLVNLKPIRPLTRRFNDLTHEEVTDMFTQGQRVCKALESHYKADAFTMAIQDGPEAGQTVPHVHLHIIPRHKGDYKNNDDIYGDLEDSKPRSVIDNESRPPRSAREMAEEALAMRKLFGQWDTSE